MTAMGGVINEQQVEKDLKPFGLDKNFEKIKEERIDALKSDTKKECQDLENQVRANHNSQELGSSQKKMQSEEKDMFDFIVPEKITKSTTNYNTIVASIIKKHEGGYYHPDFKKNNPKKFASMGISGETMMGIDRVHGVGLEKFSPDSWREFRAIIDAEKKSRHYNYLGGNNFQKLQILAGKIIKPFFDHLMTKYFTQEEQKIIYSDGRLLFNFVYGTWNGEGWFGRMAKIAKSKISEIKMFSQSGSIDTDSVVESLLRFRKESPNPLIAKSGRIMEEVFA